jgi:hypothetical protein
VLLLIVGAAFAEAQAPLRIESGESAIAVKDGDKPVLEYVCGTSLMKPYVKQLFSPGGVNVLRDQIADHPHHHGLMFAVGIDGVDFWSEAKTCGRQISKSVGPTKDKPSEFPGAAVIDNQLQWVGPQGGAALAGEDRQITAYRREGLGASLLTWRTKLAPAEGRPSIKLSGSHYFGLGMRFVQSMDGADDFFTPEGKAAGETVRGNERLVRGKWCAYAAETEGKPVTVAMFDHPANVRPAWWFIMAKSFAYMSATLNLHREPLVVEAGKPLTLTYGVAVWDGKVKAEEIEQLYARWLELAKPTSAANKP